MADVNDASRADRRRDGRMRARSLRGAPVPETDAPVHGPPDLGPGGAALVLGHVDGVARYLLDGEVVGVGDAIEVYTNTANGWVRGRFEWSGHPADRPQLALNLWDPRGPRDADGLPPWVGELLADLPPGAVARR